jgi:hypothetical protein
METFKMLRFCAIIALALNGIAMGIGACDNYHGARYAANDGSGEEESDKSDGGGGGGGEEEESDGPGKTGGATGILAILLREEGSDVILNDWELEVTAVNGDGSPNTLGKTVTAAFSGDTLPEGFHHLQWTAASPAITISPGADTYQAAIIATQFIPEPVTITVAACEEDNTLIAGCSAFFAVYVPPPPEGTGSVAIHFWTNGNDADLVTNVSSVELSRGAGNTAVITAKTSSDGYSNHQWSLKGTDVTAPEGTAETYTFSSVSRSNGDYTVGLRVEKDGIPRSTIITIEVTN